MERAVLIIAKEGGNIGRITIEFNEQDKEFFPRRRKVYRDGVELDLMAKEFNLLCFLVVNMGYVLTYGQIYEKIWGEDSIGDIKNI